MNILHLGADGFSEYNSQHWRGVIPIDALNRAGHRGNIMSVEVWMKNEQRQRIAEADIIVVERLLVEDAVERTKFWHERGKAIVIDIDDSYSRLQPSEESGNQAAKFWSQGMVDIHYGAVTYAKKLSVSPLEQFRQGLQYTTGLTSPSRILNNDWKAYCPTWVVPNYIDASRYLPFRKTYDKPPKEIIIGWGGSMSHKISFERSGVAIALRKIIAKYPHVKFMLAGDNRIIDILKLPPDRLIFQQYVTYTDWPRVLSRMDVIVAPLAGIYDDSRSHIKCSESTTMQIPIIATGSPTYEEFQKRGMGLFTSNSNEDAEGLESRAGEWFELLSETIENYDFHKRKAIADSQEAEYFWIDNRVNDIVSTYQDIINHA